jgi:hypothetical protein
MIRQYFLLSAGFGNRVSFCDHWSNGVGVGGGGAVERRIRAKPTISMLFKKDA